MRRVKKRKRIEVQRVKHQTPSWATDALIRDEKQMENRRDQNERNRKQVPNPATLDLSVTSYDSHGSYGGYVLKPTPAPQGGVFQYYLIYSVSLLAI